MELISLLVQVLAADKRFFARWFVYMPVLNVAIPSHGLENLCPTSRLVLAASAAVPSVLSATASALNIADNATGNTTERNATMSHAISTTRLHGNDCGKHSWLRIPCAPDARTMGVSPSARLLTTRLRSDEAVQRSIGIICNPCAARATERSRPSNELAGQGVGRVKSLHMKHLDRRAGTVRIAAK